MKIFTKLFAFAVICLLAGAAFSQPVPNGITLTQSADGLTVNFAVPQYSFQDIKANGTQYKLINVPDYGITSDVGYPQLPQVSFFVMIPKNETSVSYSVISQAKNDFNIDGQIYPKQNPWDKSKPDNPFVINSNYYSTKGSIDQPLVKISEPFIIGGAKGVMVTIYPFAYSPADNKISFTNKGTFKINMTSLPQLSFVPSEAMDGFYSKVFGNYSPSKATGTNRYLIITAPDFESTLAPFVSFKQSLGYTVDVFTTAVTGTSNTAIKTFIQGRYDNASTKPEFVLLVGDVDKIPEWVGGGEGTPHTDWNYSLLEGGDLWADVFLGRFPIQTTAQLTNIINKTIYMESNINSLWKKNVFMASTDNHTVSEGSHNFVIDSFFVPNQYSNVKLYSYYGATTAQVHQSLDSGKIFTIYSGHGAETYWADGPVFYQSDVNSLNNSIFPYVYSFSCLTGSYYLSSECFSETWIRSPKAAVVFWGSSVTSYWTEDDILERRLCRSMFTDNLKRTAESFLKAKIYTVQYFGSITATMQRYLEMYNCMGDPSIYEFSYGPAISHTPLSNTENLTGPYTVNCAVAPAGSNITATKLFWTRTTAFDSVSMTNSGGNNWTGNIPGNGLTSTYKYYIRTQDALGRVTYLPGGAPANYFQFTAATDIIKPVITHTALTNCPKVQWPATITATVTDNIGVDSVWVRWKKSGSATMKQFRLLNPSGSVYSAAFNSVQADVNVGDTISYRVIARDNSSMHNTDSTGLYSFTIINQVTVTVGTGTTSSNFPFTTYWDDGRTNYLYFASELGTGSGYITSIGFNVIGADAQAMNEFTIKMQNTNATSISGFTADGWTNCLTTTYTVPGSGWQMIDLATPFAYTGGNLLVEVCYNNSTYGNYSTVYASSTTGDFYGRYNDLSTASGCGYTGWSSTTNPPGKANTRFVLNPGTVSGISQQGTVIPET
ncbi:MAG TPA: C25 family cysteine peptidase, partial [Ignavibacteria bacterium]|nr:C25 family cysteine peptidase [Ignavibacteria bacterium]